MAYIDTPDSMTVADALQARASGDFASLTDGQKLLYPHFLIANPAYVDADTTPEVEQYLDAPMAAFCSAVRAKIDLEEGWHVSSSNHRVTGVEGVDVPLTFSLGDETCDAHQLNAAGVTTAVNLNGIVEWGNYSAGFPGSTAADAFECVRRTRAIMKRAIQQASIPFIDKPFIKANVDAIRNTVNQYLNSLVSQGKIVDGTCIYKPESNPLNELAMGHVAFDIEFTPALPMQKIRFNYKIDLSKLSTIA
jgi:phage tail sheath protein FI